MLSHFISGSPLDQYDDLFFIDFRRMMNYTTLFEKLKNRKYYLENIISQKTAALSRELPKGRLRCCGSKGRREYYHVVRNSESLGKYISNNDMVLPKQLAQKEYDRKVIKLAQRELSAIETLLNEYRGTNADNYFSTLKEIRQELINPITFPDEIYLQKWKNREYTKKGFAEGAQEFYSAGGTRVRSKSEILIADTLDRMGIPYYYERPLRTKSLGVIYPDFTVLNMRTRRTYFWEHCGRMDDPGYSRKWLVRLYAYEQEGIFLGERLIETFETEISPLNSRTIVRMIEHYLL